MLIGKNEIIMRRIFVEAENVVRKLGIQKNQEKTKYIVVERKNTLKI
jgi:hypothetical protein